MNNQGSPVDFVVAGFSKCGTSTLNELLSRHDEILMTAYKDSRLHEQTAEDLRESFDSWRRRRKLEKLFGTTNAWLTSSPCDVNQMAKIFRGARVILIARDPVERIESSFREFHHSGATYGVDCPREIGEAIRKLPQILEDSAYDVWLAAYRKRFGDEHIHVLLLEDLRKHPQATLARCFEFLGLDSGANIPDIGLRRNSRNSKYYDHPRLREMRNTLHSPATGIPLGKLPRSVQDQFLPYLGLRIPFGPEAIAWTPADEEYVLSALAAGVTRFLEQHDKPLEFWPRFADMLRRHG